MKNMEEKRKSKSQIICDACCGILMLVSIITYVIVGFFTGIWHPTWLIIAISAVICAVTGIISNTLAELKTLKNKDESKN